MKRKRKGRPRKPRPVTVSERGDWGPDTPAARAGKVKEAIPDDKNGTKRMRRVCVLDTYHKRGHLSARQHAAGIEISERYALTLTSPPAINENPVDSQPDYGAIMIGKMQALSNYAWIMRDIPRAMRAVVEHVCCEGYAIMGGERPLARDKLESGMHLANLQVALDLTANRMGI